MRLQPSDSEDGTIKLELKTFDLDEAPIYKALSYSWVCSLYGHVDIESSLFEGAKRDASHTGERPGVPHPEESL